MRISVKVKPNSGRDDIEKLSGKEFIIRVKAPARENKANEAAISVLSDYFNVTKSSIRLVSGRTSRNKIFDVEL